ncbi:MAG: hypothetical protein COC05_06085 [Gammaproteobacteria bacterium]|nr:hypothetical protein [Beggiatoa alba]PCH59790.1 MAG: hypothetical protein COC05_06085 [Gammaproteobacteria bacterium]
MNRFSFFRGNKHILHIALHFLVPLVLVAIFYPKAWRISYLLMLAGIAIDVDHLFADPIYDPGRCSIGYHPLHTLGPIIIYVAALIPVTTRVVGVGLCTHIVLDAFDCQLTSGVWYIV